MTKKSYQGKTPTLPASSAAFDGSRLIGDITVGENVGIWYNTTLRADMAKIVIGAGTNIQDNAVIHTDTDQPTIIGKNVTIGHSAIIHAATIEDEALIGMGSIILNQAVIEKHALIGAGSVVPPGKRVKSGTLWLGNPAKEIRKLKPDEITHIKENAASYKRLLKAHMNIKKTA